MNKRFFFPVTEEAPRLDNTKKISEDNKMEELRSNFIHDIIDEDLAVNPEMKIHTRFPRNLMDISTLALQRLFGSTL